MSEAKKTTTPRLLAAANEFNIGKETLIEFLTKKGFVIDGKPSTKLTEEMYYALEEEYAKDKAAKRKSESIELPKGSLVSQVSLSDDKKVKTVGDNKIELETPDNTVGKPEPKPKEKTKEKPQPVEEPTDNQSEETPKIESAPAAEPQPTAEENTPADKPKLEGPKIIDKIDLDALNLSTRPSKKSKSTKSAKSSSKASSKAEENTVTPAEEKPKEKKSAPKTEETPAPAPQVEEQKTTEPAPAPAAKEEPTPQQEETPTTTPEPPTQDTPQVEHIELRAPKLEGPKIIGKIELPVGDDSRPGNSKEKRKRKRIPVENKKVDSAKKPSDAKGGGAHSDRNKKRQDNRPGAKGKPAHTPTEIDAKEIQEKIRETQAKLAGAGMRTGRQLKSKYRRSKREEMAEKRQALENENDDIIQVTEFISVSELANLLDVNFTDIISKCMSLGIMVSINQRLDAEVIELVASEFNKKVEFIDLQNSDEDEEDEVADNPEDLQERAPVVTIMGHVDHGKTSLLDYIRNSSVVAGEAGGITQHIGAYKVTTDSGKEVTFLDTPGHEAFTAMRARGAKAADIAVIVIAADDAIMPQTREAISHAQAANLPMVFAINKIDKEGANPDKIKEQLAGMNILVEDWGGNYQSQEISAKKGLHVDELLEKILLEAELLELKANPNKPASGTVIEASLDKGRGYVSTVLVQGGTLKQGDFILCGQYYGKIKAMFNERGQRVDIAGPSTPVQVLGLNGAPQAGEKFKVYEDETEAKNIANHRAQILREQGLRSRKHITLDEIGRRLALGNFKELNVIIKADVDGSAEALSDSLQKLSTDEVVVNVVLKGVGQISESDIMLASASDAIVIGFQVRASAQASRVAEQENIEIRYYSIIYDAIEEIKSAIEGMLAPTVEKKIVGNIEVRETFKISGVGTIAGCYVTDGKFTRNTRINVIRDGIVIHTGELSSLKRFKDDVKEVVAGYECGLSIKNFNDIRIGDIIEGFEEVEIKRKL